MKWFFIAFIQKFLSLLPSFASFYIYNILQNNFGRLKSFNPKSGLISGLNICKNIRRNGFSTSEKTFLEIGTGRVPLVPIVYYLAGAKKVITIDLNHYLDEKLTRKCISLILRNSTNIKQLLGPILNLNRFNHFISFIKKSSYSIDSFLDFCNIEYKAPYDASRTNLKNSSIDFHTSYTVLEHIPLEILRNIFAEGNRILKDDGLFIHLIDYSDHYAKHDKSISKFNFLKYSDTYWEKIINNKFLYMNRLRHDDFLNFFDSMNHTLIDVQTKSDPTIIDLVNDEKIKINRKFLKKSEKTLSIREAWILSKKNKL